MFMEKRDVRIIAVLLVVLVLLAFWPMFIGRGPGKAINCTLPYNIFVSRRDRICQTRQKRVKPRQKRVKNACVSYVFYKFREI